MNGSIRRLIVSTTTRWSGGLHGIISAREDMEVGGAAGSGEEAVALAKSIDPDIVLLDPWLPGVQMEPRLLVPATTEEHR